MFCTLRDWSHLNLPSLLYHLHNHYNRIIINNYHSSNNYHNKSNNYHNKYSHNRYNNNNNIYTTLLNRLLPFNTRHRHNRSVTLTHLSQSPLIPIITPTPLNRSTTTLPYPSTTKCSICPPRYAHSSAPSYLLQTTTTVLPHTACDPLLPTTTLLCS